ncbi:hypothetical protein HZB01_01900 [Candidatus Woesearchaeota archaeon]|nr:hypothetical protein [Candidatus Woesearchaeota archaeon]
MDIASLGPKSDDPDVRPYYIFRARIGNGNVLSPEVRIPPTWTRLRNKPNIPLDPLDDYHYRKAVQEYMQSYLPIPQRILKATVLR